MRPGAVLGRYHLELLLGEGGMGSVFRAYDTQLRRRVALKILKASSEDRPLRGPDPAERLMREARAAAALNHQNIVSVFDVGEIEGTKFVAMELVEGTPLRAFIGRSDVSPGRRLKWLLDLARALAATHARGFIHRDIKPENVIVCADGTSKLLDFGVARAIDRPVDSKVPTLDSAENTYTEPGRVVGTPGYMAPEQARGDPVDEKSDQYAWGVLAYELISGVHPLDARASSSPQAGAPGTEGARSSSPRPLRELVAVPDRVEALVSKAMASAPSSRHSSMKVVVKGLEPYAREEPEHASATMPAAHSTEPLGQGIAIRTGMVLGGKYRVERLLGKGGMGYVVLAHHEELDQRVAIKLLSESLVHEEQIVARFTREARAAAKLQSDHVVRVMDVGRFEGVGPYMVMEYLSGSDLGHLLDEGGGLPVREAVDVVLEAIDALVEAHAHGIVHRDLKPANLFLHVRADGTQVVKVLDFGISKVDVLSGPSSQLTADGAFVGTPAYMSPEQLRSPKDVDSRADIWSLGVVLYELLSNEHPFEGETVGAVLTAIATVDPMPLRGRRIEVPTALEAAILRCLRREPGERFGSVAELAEALVPFGSGRTTRRQSRQPLLAGPLGSRSAASSPAADGVSQGGWGAVSGGRPQPKVHSGFLLAAAVLVLGAGLTGGALVYMRRAGPTSIAGASAPSPPVSISSAVDPSAPPIGATEAPTNPEGSSASASPPGTGAPVAPAATASAAKPATPRAGRSRPAAPATSPSHAPSLDEYRKWGP